MQVNCRVRMMRARMVPMLRRQRRGQGDAGHQGEADDRGAQSHEHRFDYGRRRGVRQTLALPAASPVPSGQSLEGAIDSNLSRRGIEVNYMRHAYCSFTSS